MSEPVIIPEEGSNEGYTLKGLREEVLAYQFSPGKYENLVDKWLNQAQQRAVIEGELRTQEAQELYTPERGVSSMNLPVHFSRIIDFYNPELGYSLQELNPEEFDTLLTTSGRPTVFGVYSNTLQLWPTTDTQYEFVLRYWRLPAEMIEDADRPTIPNQYHGELCSYAMWKCYLRENDYQAANEWKVIWDAFILKMRGEAMSDTYTGGRQVGGDWSAETGFPRVYRIN